MIDFANTIVLKDQPLHDEEYLFGLSNVITILETLAQSTAIAASLAWGSSSSSVDSAASQFRWTTGPSRREVPLLVISSKTTAKEYRRGLRSTSKTRRKTRLSLEEYGRAPLPDFSRCPQRQRDSQNQPSAPHAKPLRSLQHLKNDRNFSGRSSALQNTHCGGVFSGSTDVKLSLDASQRRSVPRLLPTKNTDTPKAVPLPFLRRRPTVRASVLLPFGNQQYGTSTLCRSLSESEVYFSSLNALNKVIGRPTAQHGNESAGTGGSSSLHSCLADGEEDEEDDENNNNNNTTIDSQDSRPRRPPSACNSRNHFALQLFRAPRASDRARSSAQRRRSTLSSIVAFGIRAPRFNRFQQSNKRINLPPEKQPFFPHEEPHTMVTTDCRQSDASPYTSLGSTSFTLERSGSHNSLPFTKATLMSSGSATGVDMNGRLRKTAQGFFSEPSSTEVTTGHCSATTATISVVDNKHCESPPSAAPIFGNKNCLLSPSGSHRNEPASVHTSRNLGVHPTSLATLPSVYGLLRRASLRHPRNTLSLQRRLLHCVTPTFWSGLSIQGTHGRSLHFTAPTLLSSLSIYGTYSIMLEKSRRRHRSGYTRHRRILQSHATPVDLSTHSNISSDSPVPPRMNAVDIKPSASVKNSAKPEDVLPVSQRGSKALGAFTLPHTISGIQACVSDSEEATSCISDHSSNDAPNQGDVDDEDQEPPLLLVTRSRKSPPLRKQRIFSRPYGRYMHFMLPDDRKSGNYPCGNTREIRNHDVSHLPRPRSSSCRSIVTFASRDSPLASSTDVGHHHYHRHAL